MMRLLVLLAALLCLSGCESAKKAHTTALKQAASCKLVTDMLGEPLEGSLSGFEQSSGSGSSKIEGQGSVNGPKGGGALHFEGIGDGETWSIIRGWIIAKGKTIDIVACKEGVSSR
jgi:hypothetical protein